jgi:autotransporter strand-loop-strand O-heptosyltransferase
MIYDNLKQNKNNIVEIKNKVIIYFVGGPFVEVQGNISADYTVEFIDNKSGKIYYSTTIKNNMWTKCSIEYFVEWKIRIYENGKLWYEYLYDAKDKRVYIAIDSKALGDSLAWFAYVDEFRKKHQCKVITSTFMNHMFIDQYPEITFVEPGTNVE